MHKWAYSHIDDSEKKSRSNMEYWKKTYKYKLTQKGNNISDQNGLTLNVKLVY